MPRKPAGPPEMVQVYQSDYIFDESGGRGTLMSSYFKNRSASHDLYEKTPNQSSEALDDKVIGASFSHADALIQSGALSQKLGKLSLGSKHRKETYEDSDDDWDSNVDQGLKSVNAAAKSVLNVPVAKDLPQITRTKTQEERRSLSRTSSARSSKELYAARTNDSSGLKTQVDGIVKDPSSHLAGSLSSVSSRVSVESKSLAEVEELNAKIARFNRFKAAISAPNVDLAEVRKLAWSGIPDALRPVTWQLLLGYLPTSSDRRVATLARKRKEYLDGVSQVFSMEMDQTTWHQIEIDVPRTNPHIRLYSFPATQKALERILYLWAVRHPASGYVQGINDLTTPFLQTFLSSYIDEDAENFDPSQLPKEVMDAVEADTFWCLTKLLEGIQDNYIHAQPGILRQVAELRDLVGKIDPELVKHLEEQGVEFIQFSFRWMNCMLMRELTLKNSIRMWDTYMSEGSNGFSAFHVYVCAAFLVKWSDQLIDMDFQEILMFLQSPPTQDWTEKDIELLLSEAFMWQSLYKDAGAHLRS